MIITGVTTTALLLILGTLLILFLVVLKPTVPGPPTNLTINDALTSTTEVAFSWDAPSDDGRREVIDYTVQVIDDKASFSNQINGIKETSYQLTTGISAGKRYEFRVSARNKVG